MDGMFALCDATRPLLDVVDIMRQRRDEFVRKKEIFFFFCVFWKKNNKNHSFTNIKNKYYIGGTAIHIVIRFAKL